MVFLEIVTILQLCHFNFYLILKLLLHARQSHINYENCGAFPIWGFMLFYSWGAWTERLFVAGEFTMDKARNTNILVFTEVSWEDRLFHNDAVHVDQLLPGCEADIAAHSQTHGHAGRCALGHETLFLWPKPEHILSPVCSDVVNLLPS